MDTTVPGITFNTNGTCNFCDLHDRMTLDYPLGEAGESITKRLVTKIKSNASKGSKYDCVLGISGGRDSSYTLYYAKKILGLNPLAVHFNDGFGNPIAGENMVKICKKLDVDLRTITSDWRESKDLKIAFLKASTPDMEEGTDIGIATALYGVAATENIKSILIGQSFRTEGIAPLSWNFLDGKYLKAVHKQFGTQPLRKWTPNDPGFNLGVKEMLYYTFVKGIKTYPVLYYHDYVRKNVDALLEKEFDWKNPGAHYFDDLYQSLMVKVYRVKFNIDRRLFNYSALVRSGQMSREEAIEKTSQIYHLEDPKIIALCLKRIGMTDTELEEILKLPPKTFWDYPNNYVLIRVFRYPIYLLSKLNLLPSSTYYKYFYCGK